MKRMATLAAFVAAFSFFCGATTETGVVEARAAARQTVRHSETRTRGSALRPGDCIGVVAPASWLERDCSFWRTWMCRLTRLIGRSINFGSPDCSIG